MNQQNKKYIILFVGVVLLFIIFIVVIFLQQGPKQQSSTVSPSTQDQKSTSMQQTTNINGSPSITLAPPSSSPQTAALQFYTYFFSSPKNPLANGAYKTNPYLSQDFKLLIAGAYDNGDVPVFCSQNKESNIIVDNQQSLYYNNGYLMEETISEAPPGNKNLYDILLENVNGKWLIYDINCD